MKVKRSDVAIGLFPNADGTSWKGRPVLVVQSDRYNAKIRNVIVAEITGNTAYAGDPANLLIDISTPDGKATGLNGTVKPPRPL